MASAGQKHSCFPSTRGWSQSRVTLLCHQGLVMFLSGLVVGERHSSLPSPCLKQFPFIRFQRIRSLSLPYRFPPPPHCFHQIIWQAKSLHFHVTEIFLENLLEGTIAFPLTNYFKRKAVFLTRSLVWKELILPIIHTLPRAHTCTSTHVCPPTCVWIRQNVLHCLHLLPESYF